MSFHSRRRLSHPKYIENGLAAAGPNDEIFHPRGREVETWPLHRPAPFLQ